VLALLREVQVLLGADEDHVVQRDAHVPAHEVALVREEQLIRVLPGGHVHRGPEALGLERAALDDVDLEVGAGIEVGGELHVHGVVIGALKGGEDLAHEDREVRLAEQAAEVEDVGRGLGTVAHLPQPPHRLVVHAHEEAAIGLEVLGDHLLHGAGDEIVVRQ